MPKPTPKKDRKIAPRVAHVDFFVDKERTFIKYVKYLSSPLQIMWRNFLVGAFQGIGFTLGTALLLAVIGFIITKVLGNIPFFHDFSEAVSIWLENTLASPQ